MADEGSKETEFKKHTYPLVKNSDMSEEMRTETVELVVTACEKFSGNNELAAKLIKETMDKKFGSPWNVIVGEGYGFEVTSHLRNMLYLFFGGNLAIVIWKCA